MMAVELCPRCGLPIEGKKHRSTLGPYGYLCEGCLIDRDLLYKLISISVEPQIATDISDDIGVSYRTSACTREGPLHWSRKRVVHAVQEGNVKLEEMIEIEATKFQQKGMPMYLGSMKAVELLATWHVDEWKDAIVGRGGYQRQRFERRCNEISDYLNDCDVAIIPPILVSLRKGYEFEPRDGNMGILKIPRVKGAITIIDGQHRVGGFKPIAEEAEKTGVDSSLMNYQVPVAFIDSIAVAKRASEVATDDTVKEMAADPINVESAFFFIINRLAKQVRPSHRDVLQYRMFATGIHGIPIITKEIWKIPIVPTVFSLHLDEDSPLRGLINLADIRGLQRPLHLSTFVKSLKTIFDNEDFDAIRKAEGIPTVKPSSKQVAFIKSYWNAVQNIWRDAFTNPRDYLVLRALGVTALNELMNDIFIWCKQDGIEEIPTEEDILKYLVPLEGFNWNRKTSPLGALGGMKGAKEAHMILLAALDTQGVIKAKERLEDLGLLDHEIDVFRARATEAIR